MQLACLKEAKASRINCDCKVPTKIKAQFFCTVIHSIILYCNECLVLKRQQEKKGGSSKNENVKMNVWLHKNSQDTK